MTTQTWTYPKEPPVGTIVKDNTGTQWERADNKRWESWQSLTTPKRYATWNELLMGGSPLHEQPPRYKTGKQYLLNMKTLDGLPNGAIIRIADPKNTQYATCILEKRGNHWERPPYEVHNSATFNHALATLAKYEKFTLIYQPE